MRKSTKKCCVNYLAKFSTGVNGFCLQLTLADQDVNGILLPDKDVLHSDSYGQLAFKLSLIIETF